jgi:hypothetical protein
MNWIPAPPEKSGSLSKALSPNTVQTKTDSSKDVPNLVEEGRPVMASKKTVKKLKAEVKSRKKKVANQEAKLKKAKKALKKAA